tara:strand:+ start:989 stop:1732 length:744 start_codon:yes stop_codon:yes gene_type:complete
MYNLPKLIGHRGVRNLSPENTIESIKLAKKMGLSWVEIDVKVSKDLIPILLHDDSLDRTTTGQGIPLEFNYKYLKNLDAGFFFYNKKTNICIPTLSEVLILSEFYNINLNIELKPNIGFEKENVNAIINVLKTSNFNKKYYFSSFDLNSLVIMKENLPSCRCGLLIDKFNKDISLNDVINISKKYNFFCCGFNKNLINYEIVKKIKNHNLNITIFSEENLSVNEANKLWSMGIDSIFIDDPTEFQLD